MSIIYGIIEINNKTSFGTRNEKRFYPHDKSLPMFYVPTKKPFNTINLYCAIKMDKVEKDKHYGIVEKYIGEVGDINSELEYLKCIATNNWKGNSKFKLDEYFHDNTPDRKNLTHLNTYSIDPKGCIDIDDALSIEIIDKDITKVYVHIADVASFINPNSDLDLEIRKRKESVYLQKFQVNMIPDKLSIGNISLIEGKNSRAFTLELTYKNNRLESYIFYKSLINVKNMNYEDCQKLINKKKNDDLVNLYNLGRILYEEKFSTNTNYDTHHLVEIFMIIANVCAATQIKKYNGAIFRKQDKNYEKIIQNILIDFNPAVYTNINDSSLIHDTLNEEIYTHFTSPMRRYIDIIVHRILSNKYCGTTFEIDYDSNNNKEFINELNREHKIIKKVSLTSQLYTNIFSPEFKECDNYKGIIVGFNENKIKVYVKEIGILSVKLFDKKLSGLFEYSINNDKYNLFDKENNKEICYMLNQEVDIKIGITKLSEKKINAVII
jgi:exosome complex exonuclease DIS3/RRP44